MEVNACFILEYSFEGLCEAPTQLSEKQFRKNKPEEWRANSEAPNAGFLLLL